MRMQYFFFTLSLFCLCVVGTGCEPPRYGRKLQLAAKDSESFRGFDNFTSFEWQRDSLGQTGCRQVLSYIIEKSYDLKGLPWNKCKEVFGKPDSVYVHKEDGRLEYAYTIQGKPRFAEKKSYIIVVNKDNLIVSTRLPKLW